jgi:hypothetical protein
VRGRYLKVLQVHRGVVGQEESHPRIGGEVDGRLDLWGRVTANGAGWRVGEGGLQDLTHQELCVGRRLVGEGDVDELSPILESPIDDLGGSALGAKDVDGLTLEEFRTSDARSRQHHHECDCVGAVGDDRADQSTLAVSDDPDSLLGHFGLNGQEIDGRLGVFGEVARGGARQFKRLAL